MSETPYNLDPGEPELPDNEPPSAGLFQRLGDEQCAEGRPPLPQRGLLSFLAGRPAPPGRQPAGGAAGTGSRRRLLTVRRLLLRAAGNGLWPGPPRRGGGDDAPARDPPAPGQRLLP